MFKVGVWSGGRQNEEGKKGWEEQTLMSRAHTCPKLGDGGRNLCSWHQEHSFLKRGGKRGFETPWEGKGDWHILVEGSREGPWDWDIAFS